MQEISVARDFLEDILLHARQQGLDTQRLLQRAGIAPGMMQQRQARFTAEQYTSLQTVTMREMNDEMLGYCRRPSKIGTWSAVCHWMILCRNLSQALKRFSYFYSIAECAFQVTVNSRDEELHITITPWHADEVVGPYGYIHFIYALYKVLCWLSEEQLPILAVQLPFPPPRSHREYRAIFPGAQLSFDQPAGVLILPKRIRELPIKQTAESLVRFLRNPLLNIVINDYSQQTWTGRTRALLQDQLTNIPTLEQVAGELGVHSKKLRRELEQEGISYGELKSQLRRDMAIRLLTRTKTSVEQIAYLTGFAETSTFTRAFKRWTGTTPFSYRKLGSHSLATER